MDKYDLMKSFLKSGDGLTLFAPDNKAMSKLPQSRMTKLLADDELLKQVRAARSHNLNTLYV